MSGQVGPVSPAAALVIDTLKSLFDSAAANNESSLRIQQACALAQRWLEAAPPEAWSAPERTSLGEMMHFQLRTEPRSARFRELLRRPNVHASGQQGAEIPPLEALELRLMAAGIWMDTPGHRRASTHEEWGLAAAELGSRGAAAVLRSLLADPGAPPVPEVLGALGVDAPSASLEHRAALGWRKVVRKCPPEVIAAWLSAGADPNAVDPEGIPMLMHADTAAAVGLLLDAGADPLDPKRPWPARRTAIGAWAADSGHAHRLLVMNDPRCRRLQDHLEGRMAQWTQQEREEGCMPLAAQATLVHLKSVPDPRTGAFFGFVNRVLQQPATALSPVVEAGVRWDPRAWLVWRGLLGDSPDRPLPAHWPPDGPACPDPSDIPMPVWRWLWNVKKGVLDIPELDTTTTAQWGEGLARVFDGLWSVGTVASVDAGVKLLGGVSAERWAKDKEPGTTYTRSTANALLAWPDKQMGPHMARQIGAALRAVWRLNLPFNPVRRLASGGLSSLMGRLTRLPAATPEDIVLILACNVAGPREALSARLQLHLDAGWAPDPEDALVERAVGALAQTDPAVYSSVLAALLNQRVGSAAHRQRPRL